MIEATSLRDRLCGTLRAADVGTRLAVCGWVAHRREHGEHLAFVDLRDHSGLVQCVVDGSVDVRSEYVLRVTGTVRHRPEGTVNDQLPTGDVELAECEVEVLATAEPPPFTIDGRRTPTSRCASGGGTSTCDRGGCRRTYGSEHASTRPSAPPSSAKGSARSRPRCSGRRRRRGRGST